jgi:hypothetical protein
MSKLMQKESDMLARLAAVLAVLWLLGFLAFHVTGGLISHPSRSRNNNAGAPLPERQISNRLIPMD